MWKCGVPHAYARGNCRVVISQHHRPDVSVAREEIQIDLIDNNNDQIGGATTWADKEKYTHTDGAGRLPHAVEIQMGEEEDGTVNFKYGGYEWDSNSPNCTIEHPAVGDGKESELKTFPPLLIIPQRGDNMHSDIYAAISGASNRKELPLVSTITGIDDRGVLQARNLRQTGSI